jgi:uncharacterized protein (DUF4415 family)
MDKNNAIYSTMVRAGRTTYFIDTREASTGRKYITITQSKIANQTKTTVKLRIDTDAIEQFKQAIEEAVAASK